MQKQLSEILDDFYFHYDNEDWVKANYFIRKLIRSDSNSEWNWSKLASIYYELKKYKLSLRYSKKALSINKNYPFSLWTIANSYYYLKDYQNSLKYFKIIIDFSEKEIGIIQSKMGVKWAQSLKLDTYIKLSDVCYMLERDQEAILYFKKFNSLKKQKIKSFLDKAYLNTIKKRMNKLKLY